MPKVTISRFAAACLATFTAPVFAQTSIPIRHVALHPATLLEAERTLAKIDDAALRACGASGFSLAEAKAAMRASSCWQDAVGGAVGRIGDPILSESFARFAPTRR